MKAQNASLVTPGRPAPAVDAPVLAQPLNRSKPPMPLLKIYIVEDSVVIRDNLIATLEEMAPVTVVGSAVDESSALAWLCPGEAAYDLVIIDIFLRQGSGLGVLKQLRPLRPEASLVVLTNYATPDMRQRCLALGADRVFDKSHEIDALLDYCSGLASAAH